MLTRMVLAPDATVSCLSYESRLSPAKDGDETHDAPGNERIDRDGDERGEF